MRFTKIIGLLSMGLVSLGLQAQVESGISKYGEITNDLLVKLDKNGATNTSYFLSKNGKSVPYSGMLNYNFFSNTSIIPDNYYALNATDFDRFTLVSETSGGGAYDATKLLNWIIYTDLSGITIPNSGQQFAMVVSGYFIPKETGTYTFTCEGDDAVDLFIGGTNVANHYGDHGVGDLGTNKGSIDLIAGTKYTFRARMQEYQGGEGLRVYWKKPSESNWNIDASELFYN